MGVPVPATVPTAVAVFTTDVSIRRFAEKATTSCAGQSSIAAAASPTLEALDLLTADLREFFRSLT